MKLISIIDQLEPIARILKHPGLWRTHVHTCPSQKFIHIGFTRGSKGFQKGGKVTTLDCVNKAMLF